MLIADAAEFVINPSSESRSVNCNSEPVEGQQKCRAELAKEENSRVTEFSNLEDVDKAVENQIDMSRNLSTFNLRMSICVKLASSTHSGNLLRPILNMDQSTDSYSWMV